MCTVISLLSPTNSHVKITKARKDGSEVWKHVLKIKQR